MQQNLQVQPPTVNEQALALPVLVVAACREVAQLLMRWRQLIPAAVGARG